MFIVFIIIFIINFGLALALHLLIIIIINNVINIVISNNNNSFIIFFILLIIKYIYIYLFKIYKYINFTNMKKKCY